jgi:hypothetical protein
LGVECQGQDVTLVFEILFEIICGKWQDWQNPQIPNHLGEMPGLANPLNTLLFMQNARIGKMHK